MTAYRKMISLNVRHNYYEDGLCNDLQFFPSQSTNTKIRNQHWINKNFSTGFHVVCQIDSGGKAMIPIDDSSLHYGILLRSAAQFTAVTMLDQTAPAKIFGSGKKMFFYNEGLNEALKYIILDKIIPDIYTFQFDIATKPAAVNIRVGNDTNNNLSVNYGTDGLPIPGPYLLNKNIDDSYSGSLNMKNLPDGLYTISVRNEADTGSNITTFKVFKSNEFSAGSYFGVLQIKLPATDNKISELKFKINFNRKSTIWKYYVINKSGIDFSDFSILLKDESLDNSADGNPAYEKYQFSRSVPLPTDPDPLLKITNDEVILFKSTTPIPFYQQVKTGLQLFKKEGNKETPINKNLPNPPAEKQAGDESKMYIYI